MELCLVILPPCHKTKGAYYPQEGITLCSCCMLGHRVSEQGKEMDVLECIWRRQHQVTPGSMLALPSR